MKKSLVFAMAMALGVSATAFAANPFSDVPAGHWAYAAVAKLAAAGIVDGYPDGTYKGDRTMTRYEMAQIMMTSWSANLLTNWTTWVSALPSWKRTLTTSASPVP